MFTGLTVLGDTSFELTSAGSDDEDTAIGLGGTSDHVLDEITVSGSVNDLCCKHSVSISGEAMTRETHSNGELDGLELPESDIDGDTTFTLGL